LDSQSEVLDFAGRYSIGKRPLDIPDANVPFDFAVQPPLQADGPNVYHKPTNHVNAHVRLTPIHWDEAVEQERRAAIHVVRQGD
jgi:hypothetical protein